MAGLGAERVLARRGSAWVALLVLVGGALVSTSATADEKPNLAGTYKQSALREDYTVGQWQSACGPAPSSQSSGGGETVAVRVEGDELVIVGGGRVYRSDQCYDIMPGLKRDAHSRDPGGKAWRTRCSSPPGDPRRATLQTAITATSSRIDIVETGRYEITIGDGHCSADVKRTRSLSLIALDGAPSASASATAAPSAASSIPSAAPSASTPPAPAADRCRDVGPVTRLEVRPARKLARPGDTFTLRAQLLDASGCMVHGDTSFQGDKAHGIDVDRNGQVRIASDASAGEGEVLVSAGGQHARVSISVALAQNYDDLLRQSGLNAEGESDAPAAVSIPALDQREVKADDGASRRRLEFLALVVGLATLLGITYLVLVRRNRARDRAAQASADAIYEERLREAEARRLQRLQEHEAQQRAHDESVRAREAKKAARQAKQQAKTAALPATSAGVPEAARPVAQARPDLACPVCQRTFAPPYTHCPHDGSPLGSRNAAARADAVCPVCQRAFPGQERCPDHQEALVPPALLKVGRESAAPFKGKICPTCGERFEGASTVFCGKDGAQLVLIN
jgi:hypothetical protein